MYEKPSSVDIFLAGKADARRSAESVGVDPAETIKSLHQHLRRMGYEGSRAAVGRWRLRYMRRKAGVLSLARQQLIIGIMAMTDRELDEAVARLPLHLRDPGGIRRARKIT